jgi:hypothetical protein
MKWLKIDKEMAMAPMTRSGKHLMRRKPASRWLRLFIDEAKKAAKISREIASK